MSHCIAVFTSRHATLSFANALRSHGVPAAIVNTPSSISKVCGISVKFPSDFFQVAKNAAKNFANFVGFFSYDSKSGNLKKFEF